MNNIKRHNIHLKIISALFVCIIIYPYIDSKLHITYRKKTDQPKEIFHVPRLMFKNIDTFPLLYEKHYNDTFCLQDFLVEVNSNFKIKTLGVSPNPEKVIVGKNGWLFLGGYIMDLYRGLYIFSDDELKKIKTLLDNRGKKYYEKGIHFYFTVAPGKLTIYSEYLPPWIRKVNDITLYDQLTSLFKNDTLVNFIDLRKRIIDAKSDNYLLYHKIDHHWTELGAFYAYLEITERLQKDFPQIVPHKLSDYYFTYEDMIKGSEAEDLNVRKLYHEKRIILNPKFKPRGYEGKKANYESPPDFPYACEFEDVREVDGNSLPRLVIIRDSYGDAIMKFLEENFRKSVYIFDGWGYKANYNITDNEKPDIVILMPCEVNLRNLLQNK